MKKVLGLVVLAFAAFYLFTQPEGAAEGVRGLMTMVEDAFNAVITFFSTLFR
ncbi:MAG: hypothetical protein WB441_15915 [Nocardioidaceae bacterium]